MYDISNISELGISWGSWETCDISDVLDAGSHHDQSFKS